jgi:hypothetical protein
MKAACREDGGRRNVRLGGILFVVVFVLSSLVGALQPQQSGAAAPAEELWFTVALQEGGSYSVTVDGASGSGGGLQFNFLNYLDPIKVYRSGKAYSEYSTSGDGSREDCVFEGFYDSNKKTMTGKYESTYSANDEYSQYSEEFTGTFEGTLRYRPDEIEGEPNIFTMTGLIHCSGQTESIDVDGDDEDTSESHSVVIDYDFVANGNTGAEKGGQKETPAEPGGSKIPGPGSWWQWLVGTVVPGAVAAGVGLVSMVFGGAPPKAPVPPGTGPGPSPAPPVRRPYVPPPDAPRMGPVTPYRETPDGPLVDHHRPPPDAPRMGPATPYRLDPDGPLIFPPGTPGEAGLLDYAGAALDSVKDTAGALLDGTADFIGGTAKTIMHGHAELFGLGRELADDPLGLLGDLLSPTVLVYTGLNIGGEVAESVNPAEELKSLADPDMSLEGKFWAVSSMATKAANALLLWDSLKDLKSKLTSGEQAPQITTEPVKPLDPAATTPRMSAADAVASAEKVAGDDAAFKALTDDVDAALEDLNAKAKAGTDLSPEDMRRISGSDATKRALKERGTPEAQEAFAEKQRQTYDQTDQGVVEELQKEYPGKEITSKEVSSQGQADATGSTDRDVQYLADGEPIPAKTVKRIYNEKYCEAAQIDLEQPTRGIDPEGWKKMTPAERQAAYAKQEGQTVIDRSHQEYIAELGDNDILPRDPKWTANVLEDKFLSKWAEGTPEAQVESLEQLRKLGEAAERAGRPLDPRTQAALDIVRNRSLPPGVRDLAVRNLGVPGGIRGLGSKLRSIVEVKGYVPKNAGETLPL